MKTANDMEKNETLNENYKKYIGSHVSQEGEKFLNSLKEEALKNSVEYKELQGKLKALKTSILRPVVNRFWAHKLAVAFSARWKFEIDALESLIIDTNDNIIKDGKPYAISTIAEAASFMVYLHKTITKVVRKEQDESYEVYLAVKGGLDWVNLEAACKKVSQTHNLDEDYVLSCYNKYKDESK